MPLLVALGLFAAAMPARAGDPYKLHSDFLWFVSGHGINLSGLVEGGESPFATTKFASPEDGPPPKAHVKIDDIRASVARLQTSGEHVVPAGYGPGPNADLIAASILARLGGEVDAREIELTVGIDLATGDERTLVRVVRDGRVFEPEGVETASNRFLPLYSIGQDRVRIHFKSDGRYRPPIDRTALVPFGSRKGQAFGVNRNINSIMPTNLLTRAIAQAP